MSEQEASSTCPNCNKQIDADSRFCKHCAFDLHKTVTSGSPVRSKSYLIWVVGGVCVFLILIGVVVYKSRRNQTNIVAATPTPSASPALTMSENAKQAEAKILRGESLYEGDIAGLSTNELRILRNVHFARYGRKYDQAGDLGNYFYTTSWYKPNDSYNENMLTATDKANINLILTIEKPINIASNTQPVATPIPEPNDGKLTNTKAQGALNRFVANFTGEVSIMGIQEMPAQNSAKVDFQLRNFKYRDSLFGYNRNYSGQAMALFSHYSDGRWVLTKVAFGGYPGGNWDLNIEAR